MHKAFSFNEIFYASEGLTYINVIISKINLKFIFIFILFIISYIIILKLLNYFKKQEESKKSKVIKIIILIVIVLPLLFHYREKNINSLGYFYNHKIEYYADDSLRGNYETFNDKEIAIKVAGIYEYTIRDIYLYLKTNIFSDKIKQKKQIDNYFKKNKYDVVKNEYTGLFKDKNIIIVMAESIDDWLIKEDIMPTVYNMKENSIDFINRYSPFYSGGRTIENEYSLNTGLYIPVDYNIYNSINNSFSNSLPNMFNSKNYVTNSIHFNNGYFYSREKLHKAFGYKNSYFLLDMDSKEYKNDAELVKNNYNLIVSKDNKFMSLFITYSAHLPYDKNNKFCKNLNNDEYACIKKLAAYTDEAMKILIEKLKKDNLLDDTVIVFVTDHYTYGFDEKEMEKIKGGLSPEKVDKVPFFIWNNNKNKMKVDKYIDNQDMIPTLLNLFDIKYNSNMYIGTDIFSKNHDNYVYFNNRKYVGNKKISVELINEKIEINDLIIKTNYYENK